MRNIEALKNYFLGRDPQLHETCADNSLRLIGIPGREFVLRKEFIDKLKELKTRVDTEDERLQAEIDGLIRDLEAEAAIRQNQDNILSRDIYDEELARKNADNILTNTFNNYYTKTEIDNQRTFTKLTSDLRIPANDVPDLETGWYNTGDYSVYYNDNVDPLTFPNALFYYDNNPLGQHFEFSPGGIEGDGMLRAFGWFDIDNHEWNWDGWWTTYTISENSTDYEIPTAATVSNYMVYKAGDTMTGQLTTPNLVVGSAGGLLGNNSMANGANNTVTGDNSHAEGQGTVASGDMQHTEGGFNEETTTETVDLPTQAATLQLITQRVIGGTESPAVLSAAQAVKNAYQDGVYAQVVGNGVSGAKSEYRSNAYTLDWDGNAWFAGKVFVGSTGGKHKDAGSKRLVTEDEYDQLLDQIPRKTITTTNGTANVQDSSNLPPANVEVLGNATQDLTPTPSAPVDINVVTGNNTIKVTGKNLFNKTGELVQFGTNTKRWGYQLPKLKVGETYSAKMWLIDSTISSSAAIRVGRLESGEVANVTSNIDSLQTFIVEQGYDYFISLAGTSSKTTAETAFGNNNIELEVGNGNNISYEPYTEQSVTLPLGSIELAKIGNYADRIYKDNGKWWLEKNIIKYTFTGNETWTPNGYGTNSWNLTNVITTNYVESNLQIICNIFKGIPASERNTAGSFVIFTASNNSCVVRNTTYTQASDIKTATAGNVIYYYTNAPTTTEITDTALIAALEQALAMITYKNVTNFSITPSGTNATGDLTITYRQDLQTLTDQIATLEARVTLLES